MTIMNRQEHLEWCKLRAMNYVRNGDYNQAFASFQSDMSKHEETQHHLALELGTMLLLGGHLQDKKQITDWIMGFN